MYRRNCPRCGAVIHYTNLTTASKADKNNSICASCRTSLNNKSPNRNAKQSNNPAWRGYGDVPGKTFSRLKRGANKRNIEFCLTIEDIQNQYEKQNKVCAFTGIPLKFGMDASIDRIDSKDGYHPNNIQIVHKTLNMMKKDLDNTQFINWCKMIAKHN